MSPNAGVLHVADDSGCLCAYCGYEWFNPEIGKGMRTDPGTRVVIIGIGDGSAFRTTRPLDVRAAAPEGVVGCWEMGG